MNKRSVLFFFIAFIVLISTLGVFAVGFANHESHTTCPITVFSSDDCSSMSDTLSMVMHHISGIQSFTEGIATSGLSIVLMILSVAVVSLYIKPVNFLSNLVLKSRYIYIKYTSHPIFKRILKWLVLRNKMDIYSYARASDNFTS
jgi:hypothetical protein